VRIFETSSASWDSDWLYFIQISAGETTDYAGDDFPNACLVSRRTRKPIWEHKNHKGYFVVDVAPLQKVDPKTDNWHCYGVQSL
jgi:hypothetical protein